MVHWGPFVITLMRPRICIIEGFLGSGRHEQFRRCLEVEFAVGRIL